MEINLLPFSQSVFNFKNYKLILNHISYYYMIYFTIPWVIILHNTNVPNVITMKSLYNTIYTISYNLYNIVLLFLVAALSQLLPVVYLEGHTRKGTN